MRKPTRTNKANKFFGHNFGIVYRFEVVRTLKKKSFWLNILTLPLLLAAIFAVTYFANQSGSDSFDKLAEEQFSFVITDESGVVNHDLVGQLGGSIVAADDKQASVDRVQSGELEAYFYYPTDLATQKVEIYAQEAGLFGSGKYNSVAKALLTNSVQTDADPNIITILSDNVQSSAIYYKNGKEYNQLGDMIVPGMFLILFYLIIAVFGNQMLTATVEEKENRISEMILTTIKSRTLIVGKIFAFITLILIQALTIIGLVACGYLIATSFLDVPSLDLSIITFDPVRIAIAAAIFVIATLMFSGIMVAIGAAAPTAKEANQFMTVPILLLFVPLYFTSIMLTTPEATIIQIMIYFPLTAPVLLLAMNAIGTLSVSTAIACIVIMTITTIVIFVIASRLFQTGAIEYHKRIRLLPQKTK